MPRNRAKIAGGARQIRPLRLTARAEVPKASDPKAVRTFRLVANTGEPMSIWPYDLPVVIDMESIDLSGLPVPALYDHNPDVDYVVGTVDSATAANGELVAVGRFTVDESIPPDRNYAKKVLNKADAGHAWQTSVGGDPKTVEEVKAGGVGVANWGRQYPGPVLIARGLQTREISFVVLGGDRRTSAVVARHRISLKGTAMTFEQFCLSKGFDPATLDEVQLANLQLDFATAYPEGATSDVAAEDLPTDEEIAAMDDPADVEEEIAAIDDTPAEEMPTNAAAVRVKLQSRLKKLRREARISARRTPAPAPVAAGAVPPRSGSGRRPDLLAAERSRIKEITTLCQEHGNPKIKAASGSKVALMAHALTEGWTVDQVKTELLKVKRADRPTGPNVIVKSHEKSCTLDALACAVLLRAGGKLDHKGYQTQQAIAMRLPGFLRQNINAEGRQRAMEAGHRYASMHAMDFARECLRLDGRDVPHERTDMIRAAFSGGSLTNVFTTSINAKLLATYLDAADTTVGWVREQDVNDYRLQERPRKNIGKGMKKLPRGGKADHRSRNDTGESYKIARFSGQTVIDEIDFVNDSLGALSDEPVDMGMECARLRPDLVYAVMLRNDALAGTGRALFNTTDGNRNTSRALSIANVKYAIQRMMLLQENGVNLSITPTHLIVPPTLKHDAYEIVNSSEVMVARGGTTDITIERGGMNSIAAEGLIPVCDARLENGLIDPDDETTLSGSSSNWHLASALAHTIEVGYLAGTGRAPQVRPFKLDRGEYGLGWDCQMAIGAAAMDWKGLQRNEQ